jgi:hypothetical protein
MTHEIRMATGIKIYLLRFVIIGSGIEVIWCGAYCYKSLYTPHYVSPYNVGYVPHWTLG